MAHTHEKIEYLLGARRTYGDFTPPFTQRGLAIVQRPIKVRLLDDTREIKPVRFCAYNTPFDDLYYATVRLDGHAYIIKPLRREWSQSDSVFSHRDDRFWYVWQGSGCHFRGPQFDGPVARSVERVNTGKERRVASLPGRTISSPAPDSARTLSDRILPNSSPLRCSPSLMVSQLRSGFVNYPTRAEDQEAEDVFTGDLRRTLCRVAHEQGIVPYAASRAPSPDAEIAPTPARSEMDMTVIGLARGNNTDHGYLPMSLHEFRPLDGSAVTMESLFEKITRVYRVPNKEFFILQRAFVPGPPNPQPNEATPKASHHFMISREAQGSWDFFLSDLRHQIRDHGVQGWHVRLHAYSA